MEMRLALTFLFAGVFVLPTAVAQNDVFAISADPEIGEIQVARLQGVRLGMSVTDYSRDQNQQAVSHAVNVQTRPLTNGTRGWSVIAPEPNFNILGGQTLQKEILVSAAANPQPYLTKWEVTVTMSTFNGSRYEDSFEFTALLTPYYQPQLLIKEAPATLEPYGQAVYNVEVSNLGAYPDTFDLRVTPSPGWIAGIQPKIALQPDETQNVKLVVVAPSAKAFYQGESAVFTITASSANDPGLVFTTTAVASVAGFYIPPFWWPHLALGTILLGTVISGARSRMRISRLEDGPPRPVRLTPAQEEALFRLKYSEPEAYKTRRAELDRIYRVRRGDYRSHLREKHHHFLAEKRAQHTEAARVRRERAAQLRADAMDRAARAREAARLRGQARRIAKAKRKQLQRAAAEERRARSRAAREARRAFKADAGRRKAEKRAEILQRKDEAKKLKQLRKLEKVKAKLVSEKQKQLANLRKEQEKAQREAARRAKRGK